MSRGMLKIKVTDEIEFAYYDSGAPPDRIEYDTIVLIHGHTYHTGTFKPMLEQANSYGYRIILPSRRLYQGSTPYTKAEADALGPNNSTEEILEAYIKQGEYLLLFLNNLITEQRLQSVVLVGWSQGTGFVSAMVAAITSVNNDVQSNIRNVVKSAVWWDPPATIHGIADPPTGGWIPLYDESIPPTERGQVFSEWITHYYPHKDMEKKDCHNLIYKITSTPVRTPSFSGLPIEEFLTKIDLTAGINGDNHIPDKHFQPVGARAREISLFDPTIRALWGGIPFNVIYGEESPYNIVWGSWKIEEEAKERGVPLKTISMPGANHFAMEDMTSLIFDTLKVCL